MRTDKSSNLKVTRLPGGRLVVDATLSRSGVFEYRDSAGNVRREYRAPEEVFSADSIASFELAPLTNDHPVEGVTEGNAKAVTVGAVGSVARQDVNLVGRVAIFDEATLAAIEAGKHELSCGYLCDVLDEPGTTPEGERYDAVQRNIVGNHVALVERGRAGNARLHLDSAISTDFVEETKPANKDDDSMELEALKAELAKLTAAVADLTSAKDKIEGERDALTAQVVAADAARADAIAKLPAAVEARVALLSAARDLKVDVKPGDTDRAIKVAVVAKMDGATITDDKSDDYVTARFDAAVERAAKSKQSHRSLNLDTKPKAPVEEARERMIAHNRSLKLGVK